MTKNLQKIFIILLTLFLISCGNTPKETVKVRLGTIQNYFTEMAKTYLDSTTTINLPTAGKLEKITLDVGATVHQGDVLAQLQQLPLQLAVEKANQSYIAAKKYYKSVQQQTIASAATYHLSQLTLKRNKKLINKGYISKQRLDQLKADYITDKSALLEQQQKEKAFNAVMGTMQAQLKQALYNLNNSTLRAPMNGTILTRNTKGNLWLTAGTAIMQIGNPNQLEATSSVLSIDAASLKVGDQVAIGADGYQYPYKGIVKKIYPSAFTTHSALGVKEQRVKVIVALSNPQKINLGVNYQPIRQVYNHRKKQGIDSSKSQCITRHQYELLCVSYDK